MTAGDGFSAVNGQMPFYVIYSEILRCFAVIRSNRFIHGMKWIIGTACDNNICLPLRNEEGRQDSETNSDRNGDAKCGKQLDTKT